MDSIKNTKKSRSYSSFMFWLFTIAAFLTIAHVCQAKDSIIQKFYNYPNPFQRGAEETHIVYQVKKPMSGAIKIYDLNGGLVWQKSIKVATENINVENMCNWNGTTSSGQLVSPGVYLCVFKIKVSEKSVDLYETRTLKIGVKR